MYVSFSNFESYSANICLSNALGHDPYVFVLSRQTAITVFMFSAESDYYSFIRRLSLYLLYNVLLVVWLNLQI